MIFSSATLWFISIACVPLSVAFFLWSLKQKNIWWSITTLVFVFIAYGLIVIQQYEDYSCFTDCIRKGFNYNAYSGECSLGAQDIK